MRKWQAEHAKPWWPAVYVEHTSRLPEIPSPYDTAAGNLACSVVDTLMKVLPSSNIAADFSAWATETGTGLTQHELDEQIPRILPRIVVSTPTAADAEPIEGLTHYRFPLDVFEPEYRWVRPHLVTPRIVPDIDTFRRAVQKDEAERVHFPYVTEILGRYQTHASSFQLARVAVGVTNEIVMFECQAAGVPDEYVPEVTLSGLSITRGEGNGIIASPYELGL